MFSCLAFQFSFTVDSFGSAGLPAEGIEPALADFAASRKLSKIALNLVTRSNLTF